jgi:hypothetical protein
MGAIMKRIAKQPPARAYASMADMCYKHYELALAERKMVDASRWLLKAHTYRKQAGQIGHEKELSDANC